MLCSTLYLKLARGTVENWIANYTFIVFILETSDNEAMKRTGKTVARLSN